MDKNLLAVLIGGGALLAWSMSKAATNGNGAAACSPDLLAAGWSEIPGVGVPGETGYRALANRSNPITDPGLPADASGFGSISAYCSAQWRQRERWRSTACRFSSLRRRAR